MLTEIKEINKNFIVCDVLNVSICVGSLWASKVVGVKSVGIMTDMPGLMVNQSHDVKRRSIKSLFTKFNKSYLSCFSSYVFLTEQMNSAVNRKSRPYLVMEGLVDEGMSDVIMYTKESFSTSCDERIILYAGGLHEKYGLKTLVEAFLLLPHNDIRLHLYGNGPFVKQLKDDYCKRDPRIVYHGIVTNEEVIIDVDMPKGTLYLKVWKIDVGRVSLYLLDSDIEKNIDEYKDITIWNIWFQEPLFLLLNYLECLKNIIHIFICSTMNLFLVLQRR